MAKIIVIDGLDGSGKATQAELLRKYIESLGRYKVYSLSFPDYDSDSSAAVKMYLNGKIGTDPEALSPYMCSSFYAIDRAIQYHLKMKDYMKDDNSVIVLDRYLSANIIHQGAKIKNSEERHKFYKWVYDYETRLIGIPMEDLTIILSVPVDISQSLMTSRYNGDNTKKDIHEANVKYLNDCYFAANDAYEYLKSEGYAWDIIHCESEDKQSIKSREEIHRLIVEKVNKVLGISN